MDNLAKEAAEEAAEMAAEEAAEMATKKERWGSQTDFSRYFKMFHDKIILDETNQDSLRLFKIFSRISKTFKMFHILKSFENLTFLKLFMYFKTFQYFLNIFLNSSYYA